MLEEKGTRLTSVIQNLADVMYKITSIVMEFSPIGVCALLADSVGTYGVSGAVPAADVIYTPLYRNPRRIFGIGLNYVDHAGDIGSAAPTGFPGSFFKQADTLIGPGDEILLPRLKETQKTTAEAELGVIMGRDCRDVSEANWESAVVGYTTVLDMTEESILKGNDYVQGNPRYLTIVKNFPTFFSFGPELVTPDEVPDVFKLEVQSVLNGGVHAKNVVSNMTHCPAKLVSLHSSIQGWYAGDVLSTGTPRAFHIQDGDIAECRIYRPDGFEMKPLLNPVVDLKLHPEKQSRKAFRISSIPTYFYKGGSHGTRIKRQGRNLHVLCRRHRKGDRHGGGERKRKGRDLHRRGV